MPVATHALSGNFSALVGEITRLRATIHANSEDGSWVNELDDEIKLGGALLNTANDGTFTVTLPTSTGTGLQYEVRAQYVDPADQQRKSWSSGWFDLTANANVADKANDSSLRVNPSLGAQLAQRIDGFIDHGNVSGAVTFSGPTGSHWFDAAAATTITLDGFTEGQVVSLLCFTGADDVTVTGLPDLELADGLVVSAIRARGVWVTGGGGGGTPAVPDTTPPSAVTTLVATGGEEQIVLSWSASTDAENSVSYRYRVWLTSGGASGAWTTTTATGATVTGLAAGAYTAEVYAYSAGGASATDTATATVTVPVSPILAADTFTAADGTTFVGRSTPVGGRPYSVVEGTGMRIMSNRMTCTSSAVIERLQVSLAAPVPSASGVRMTADYDATGIMYFSFFNGAEQSVQLQRAGSAANISGVNGGSYVSGPTSAPASGAITVTIVGSTLTVVTGSGTTVLNCSGPGNITAVGFVFANGGAIDNLVIETL